MSMTLQPPSKHDPFCFPVSDFSSCPAKSLLPTIEPTGTGIAYWDFHHHRVHWSKQLASLYGLNANFFYRSCQGYLQSVHSDDRLELKVALEQVKSTLNKTEIEYRVCVDRQEKWLRSCFTPVVEQGNLSYIVEFVTDISELRAAQNALIHSELRWRNILEHISDVLIETTFTGEIISVTNSVSSLWGYHSDELRGINLLSIVEFEDSFSLTSLSSFKWNLPVLITANVLYKSLSYHLSQCSVHVDDIRQTLLFVFKPHCPPSAPPNAIAPLRDAIALMTNALMHRYALPTIYTILSECFVFLLQADCIHIYQYNPQQFVWHTVYDHCPRADLQCAAGFEFLEPDHPISEVLARFEPAKSEDWSSSHPMFAPALVEQFAGAWMVLPILVNASIWGAILVTRFDEAEHWNEQELNQAIVLGDYLNLAIAAQPR
jgi:PAS domain-containing protein